MLMTSCERPVAVTQYETALALRRMALLQPYLPKWGRLRERAKSYAKALANDILR